MSTLPQVPGGRLVRALGRAGWRQIRQHGSHVYLTHPEQSGVLLVVPVHGSKSVKPGTLRGILRDAGLSADELREFL